MARSDLVSGSVALPIVEHMHLGETAPALDGVALLNSLFESDATDVGVEALEFSLSLSH